ALDTVMAAIEALRGQVEAPPPTIEGILGLKGVLEQRDRLLSAEAEEELIKAILACTEQVLQDLALARRQEGSRIAAVLLERLDEIEALVQRAETHPARSRDVILAKLRQQVVELATDITIPE